MTLIFTVALHVATLLVRVQHPGRLTVLLYGAVDSAASEVMSSFERPVGAGMELFEFKALPAGSYFVEVKLGNDVKRSSAVEVKDE